MNKNDKKSIDELIMEEVERNPILTEEELKELLETETEEEIRREEELNEAIFRKVLMIEEELRHILSDTEFKKIVAEEIIKRKRL